MVYGSGDHDDTNEILCDFTLHLLTYSTSPKKYGWKVVSAVRKEFLKVDAGSGQDDTVCSNNSTLTGQLHVQESLLVKGEHYNNALLHLGN